MKNNRMLKNIILMMADPGKKERVNSFPCGSTNDLPGGNYLPRYLVVGGYPGII